jgi:hypothetical protein
MHEYYLDALLGSRRHGLLDGLEVASPRQASTILRYYDHDSDGLQAVD